MLGLSFELDADELRVRKVAAKRTIGIMTARAVRIGINAAADYARDHHEHTVRTGLLTSQEMLYGQVVKSNDEETWGYLRNDAPYAGYVENGTQSHEIRPINYASVGPMTRSEARKYRSNGSTQARHSTGRNAGKVVKGATHGAGRGQALRFVIGGKVIFARVVNHPGSKPYPFMGPASKFAEWFIRKETEEATIEAVRAVLED